VERVRGDARLPRGLLLLAALFVLALASAPRAEAFIYWTNGATPPCRGPGSCEGPPVIGRANLDGAGVSQRFIELESPAGDIAVDGAYLYWGEDDGIARADLDGAGVDTDFITTGYRVGSIAVDTHHIYWLHGYGIARANLDGTSVNPEFIATAGSPIGLAVDPEHIYWALHVLPNPPSPTAYIGRANLDGTGVDQSFIETEPGPGAYGGPIAVGTDHIYWNDHGNRTIARANLDGSGIDRSFIAVGYATGVQAVDTTHIYWTGCEAYRCASPIGRANLDGTGVNREFISATEISTFGTGLGLTVDALTDTQLAGKARAAKAQKQSGNAIVVKVKVKAGERLTAKASGKIKLNPTSRLKPKKIELTTGEASTLRLKPKKKVQGRKIAAALKQGESASAKLTVMLSDLAGNSEVEKLRVKLNRG
jgi:hypothetical protein